MTVYFHGRIRQSDRILTKGQTAPREAEFGEQNFKKYIRVVGINI